MATRAELTPADRAALLAARAWGGRPWARLAPGWRDRLRAAGRDLPADPHDYKDPTVDWADDHDHGKHGGGGGGGH